MLIKYFKYAGLIVLLTSLTLVSVNAQDDDNQSGWTNFTAEDGIPVGGNYPNIFITSIAVAPNDNVWISTWDGIAQYDGETWTKYTETDGLLSNRILAVDVAPDGIIWAGTSSRPWSTTCSQCSISRFDGESWTIFANQDGLNPIDAYYSSIVSTPNGDIWVASGDGIHVYDGQTWHLVKKRRGRFKIAVAPDETLWVSGFCSGCDESWVYHFDGETWLEFTEDDGVIQGYLYQLVVAPNGDVWMPYSANDGSGQSGLLHYDGENWITFTSQDHWALSRIFYLNQVASAPNGTVWVTTGEGVLRFDGTTWTQFTTEDGLGDNHATAITVAPDGTVWIGTRRGVSRYIPPQE